mgnify:CR=1 FL=1
MLAAYGAGRPRKERTMMDRKIVSVKFDVFQFDGTVIREVYLVDASDRPELTIPVLVVKLNDGRTIRSTHPYTIIYQEKNNE